MVSSLQSRGRQYGREGRKDKKTDLITEGPECYFDLIVLLYLFSRLEAVEFRFEHIRIKYHEEDDQKFGFVLRKKKLSN